MHALENKNVKGILYAALAFFLFNIADSFIKGLSPIYGGAYTGFLAVLFNLSFILLIFKIRGKLNFKAALKSKKRPWLFLRGVIGSIGFLCFINAIGKIDLATAYSLILTAPFWAALFAVIFYREKIGWHRIFAIFIGFTGVLVVLRPDSGNISIYAILLLCLAFLAGISFILSRKIGEKEPLVHFLLYVEVISAIIIGIFCYLYSDWVVPQPLHILYIAISAAFYLAGMVFVHRAFSMAETSAVAPIHYTQVIWGTLIGYFIFQEVPDKWTVVGGTIIVASGLYLIYREHIINGPHASKRDEAMNASQRQKNTGK